MSITCYLLCDREITICHQKISYFGTKDFLSYDTIAAACCWSGVRRQNKIHAPGEACIKRYPNATSQSEVLELLVIKKDSKLVNI